MRKMSAGNIVVAALCLTGWFVSLAYAQTAVEVKPKIEHVMLFKNGLGYFESTAVLPEKATVIKFNRMPVPSLGTFWVGYPKKTRVKGIFTSMEETNEPAPAANTAQILAVNLNRKVTVELNGKTITGVIKEVTQTPKTQPMNPYLMDSLRPAASGYSPYGAYPPYGNLSVQVVVLKTDSGTVMLNANSISRVDFEGDDAQTSVAVSVKKPVIRMELVKDSGGEKVGISYLCRGITWTPGYLIDLSDAKTARLTANALVLNETADLDNVALDLVTGFPNIQFADINSPVSMTQSLADFLKALQTGRSESSGNRGNIMTQQAITSNLAYFREGDEASFTMPSYSTAAAGTVAEDLFLYPVENFSLKSGETAYVPLFTAEVPYEHIYVWKIRDYLDENEQYQSSNRANAGKEPAEEVWHSCRLSNTMKMPWTTAPAEFVKNGSFVGQDTCYYTAPGAKTDVRINRAMNIIAEQAEMELERKRNAANFYGWSYDLVKVQGELKLKNRLDKSANLEITKELSGEVKETSIPAKDTVTAKGLKKVNPRHILAWTIELQPGAEQTITYTYEVYIRS